ncbi:hypothetical protein [Actinacidiphila reveromycinica]|nr:hypothetical protein [Streptomyces sp. SN-593]
MIARTRTARAVLRARTRTHRAAAAIRRTGAGTLATHAMAAGLAPRAARTVAGSLRKVATKLGITGRPGVSYTHGRARHCRRYTAAQVAVIAAAYRPRLAAYRAARQHFLLAA